MRSAYQPMKALKQLRNKSYIFSSGLAACRSNRTMQRQMSCSNNAHGSVEAEIAPSAGSRPRRPVVTAFVRREDGKLLVVKRSDKVSTYRQQWGGVSGGVEGNESLLDRALTEIVEETGLTAQQLQLVAFGRPLPVDDGRRRFLVYNFLFQLTDPAASVTLNWENVAYDWVPPSGVAQLDHVPLLPETVQRLLLPPYMQTHIQYLKADRRHGAAELAAYVLQALRAIVGHEERLYHGNSSSIAAASPLAAEAAAAAASTEQKQQQQPTFDRVMEEYKNFCFHVAVARPSMAAVANCAADVLVQLQQEAAARADAFEPTAGMARVALADAVAKLSDRLQQQQTAVVNNGAALLQDGMVVLTTSLSSTVAKVLIQAHQQVQAAAATAAAAVQQHPSAPSTASISAGVAMGAAGHVVARPGDKADSKLVSNSAAAACGDRDAGASSSQHQHSIDLEDWVDDPEFWPSSSGIGRGTDHRSGNSRRSGSAWIANIGPRDRRRDSSRESGSQTRGPGISVIVCESRPLCEGVVMAQRLAEAGINVTVITDAQAAVFVDEADVVLLGADAVTPDGVVNKVGSKLLAVAAKDAGVPVVAVAECLKISPGPVSQYALPNTTIQEGQEEKDASEVLQAWRQDVVAAVEKSMLHPQSSTPSNTAAAAAAEGSADSSARAAAVVQGCIDVRNVYFEAVPLRHVTGLVTDRGYLSQAVVAELIKQRVHDYQQAFGLAVTSDMLVS